MTFFRHSQGHAEQLLQGARFADIISSSSGNGSSNGSSGGVSGSVT
jgi:hypothetical protein